MGTKTQGLNGKLIETYSNATLLENKAILLGRDQTGAVKEPITIS